MAVRSRPERRLVILTEGQFGIHDAKTAIGVIRYGRDDVVAVLDSTMAGPQPRASSCPRFDIPFVATLDEALARPGPPDGAAHRHRPDRRQAAADVAGDRSSRRIAAGLDIHSGLHTVPRRRPGVRRGRRGGRRRGSSTTGGRPSGWRRPSAGATCPGKRVILTVGTDCAIGKMSVALELRRGRRGAPAPSAVDGPDRPDRDDDRGLGRGRRPGHQRLHQRHRRVARRAGRGARRLGHRRGPGLDRPPGLQRRDAGPHPRGDAARDGPGPQAGPRPSTTSTTCPRRRSRSPSCRPFIELHERIAGLVAPSKVVAIALNTSLFADDDEARRVIAEIAAETGLPADDPVRFGPDRLWAAIRDAVEALPWVG